MRGKVLWSVVSGRCIITPAKFYDVLCRVLPLGAAQYGAVQGALIYSRVAIYAVGCCAGQRSWLIRRTLHSGAGHLESY